MAKKNETSLDYSNMKELLVGRSVIVGLNGGTNLTGDVRYLDDNTLVLVTEPKSKLDIETKVVTTLVPLKNVDFVQFKTDRE